MPKENSSQRLERVALVQTYRESGQTIAEFARERGSTPWKIRYAVRRTEKEEEKISGFQEIAVPLSGSSVSDYSIVFRSGRELRIPAHFSEKRVRQLIEIVESC